MQILQAALSDQLALSMEGCGYQIINERVVIAINTLANHRDALSISGSLSLELWALPSPYQGSGFSGNLLAATHIGQILDQHFLAQCQYDLIFTQPPQGEWFLSLMLREWDGEQFITRDYVNFELPYRVASLEQAKTPLTRRDADNVISVDFTGQGLAPKTLPKTEAEVAPSRVTLKVEARKTKAKTAKVTTKKAKVAINKASLEEIENVKGLPAKVAKAIFDARPFKSVDALLAVKGMGPKLLKKLEEHIRV